MNDTVQSWIRQQTIRLQWSDEDRVWIARVDNLPGCMAHGDTLTEAVQEIEVAIGLFAETLGV